MSSLKTLYTIKKHPEALERITEASNVILNEAGIGDRVKDAFRFQLNQNDLDKINSAKRILDVVKKQPGCTEVVATAIDDVISHVADSNVLKSFARQMIGKSVSDSVVNFGLFLERGYKQSVKVVENFSQYDAESLQNMIKSGKLDKKHILKIANDFKIIKYNIQNPNMSKVIAKQLPIAVACGKNSQRVALLLKKAFSADLKNILSVFKGIFDEQKLDAHVKELMGKPIEDLYSVVNTFKNSQEILQKRQQTAQTNGTIQQNTSKLSDVDKGKLMANIEKMPRSAKSLVQMIANGKITPEDLKSVMK